MESRYLVVSYSTTVSLDHFGRGGRGVGAIGARVGNLVNFQKGLFEKGGKNDVFHGSK